MQRRQCLVILFSAACSLATRADIYSFVDADGTAHFTNVPSDARYQILIVATKEETWAGERLSPDFVVSSAKRYEDIIEAAAERTKVEASLLRAVIAVESGYNARAVSKAGARGLMQLMPETARRFGAIDSFDPAQNVHAGASYLSYLIKRYRNDLKLVLAAYNAGETAVERYGRAIPPYKETRRYVPRVLDIYRRLSELRAT
jgi:soluble lytic murein transglycosylase-like protein